MRMPWPTKHFEIARFGREKIYECFAIDSSHGYLWISRLNMVTKFFERLDVYHDFTPRSAALNMAIDEALLEVATIPSIRFYGWHSPALSFGYFGRFADVGDYAAGRDLVRRWTGGGIVFHGDDLTYSIIIPAASEFSSASSKSIYAMIHAALCDALNIHGQRAELAPAAEAAVTDSEKFFASRPWLQPTLVFRQSGVGGPDDRQPQDCGGSATAHARRFAASRQHPTCRSWEWSCGALCQGVVEPAQRKIAERINRGTSE